MEGSVSEISVQEEAMEDNFEAQPVDENTV